jgi:O-antigen/teichoic acid export membrane protein
MTGSRRAVTTLVDQSFASVSNFGLGVAIARTAGVAGLGGFAVAYAGWQVLAAMHRSLITDPMAIEGDLHDARNSQRIQRGFAAEVLLGFVATAIFVLIGTILFLTGQAHFGIAVLALALWLPSLVVQDYWRWVGFMSRRPGRALANDTVFNLVQGGAFVGVFVVHLHSSAALIALIAAWGLGGTAGALYGLWQYGVLPSFTGGLLLLRARWPMSKWIASQSLTTWGASQAYILVAAAILGPVGIGGLKAAQTLVSGPSGVLIQAGGSIGLPEASRAYAERGWSGLIRVSRFVTGAGVVSFGAVAVIVAVWGRDLLSAIYGREFAHVEFAAILFAISYVVSGSVLGPILILKATRNTRWLFQISFLMLIVSLAGTAALSLVIGIDGAAGANIAAQMVTAVGCRYYQHRIRGSLRQGNPPVAAGESLDRVVRSTTEAASGAARDPAQGAIHPPALSPVGAERSANGLHRGGSHAGEPGPSRPTFLVARAEQAAMNVPSAARDVVPMGSDPDALGMSPVGRADPARATGGLGFLSEQCAQGVVTGAILEEAIRRMQSEDALLNAILARWARKPTISNGGRRTGPGGAPAGAPRDGPERLAGTRATPPPETH